ncbi:unnamed protein product [Prunus armeniaca]
MKRDEVDKARNEAFAREIKYAHKQDMNKKDRETRAMDRSHMSLETRIKGCYEKKCGTPSRK